MGETEMCDIFGTEQPDLGGGRYFYAALPQAFNDC